MIASQLSEKTLGKGATELLTQLEKMEEQIVGLMLESEACKRYLDDNVSAKATELLAEYKKHIDAMYEITSARSEQLKQAVNMLKKAENVDNV